MTIEASDVTVLKLLARGREPAWVAQATSRRPVEVERIGREQDWPDLPQLQANLEKLGVHDDAPRHAPGSQTPSPRPAPAPARSLSPAAQIPAAAAPGTGKLELLLARAGRHDTAAIRAARNAVLTACTRLEQALQKQEQKTRERNERDAAKAAARSRVEQLERQLREAKAALRGKPAAASSETRNAKRITRNAKRITPEPATPRVTQGARIAARVAALGVSSRTIRAWAKSTDVDVPTSGALPNAVIDAWEAAHSDAAAS